MSMPERLVFVRHGESEANVVHKAERRGDIHPAHDGVYARPDWEQRLSALGVEQAKIAGQWICENIMPIENFDRRYVSTFQRAAETALYLSGGKGKQGDILPWYVDDRFRERDWGEYGATPYEERKKRFPFAVQAQENNPFYAGLNGAESYSDMMMRIRDTHGTYHRDVPNGSVLVVAHGEFITGNRYQIERLLPEEIMEIDKDPAQDMKNCAIIDYTRRNPENSEELSNHISWMRMIYPYDVEIMKQERIIAPPKIDQSPNGGQWIKINEKRLFSLADISRRLQLSPPLTRNEDLS